MDNTFYYFFSTVPQVLGAAMGLFGLFVLFKIQILKEEILEVSTDLKKSLDLLETKNERKEKSRLKAIAFLSKAIQIKNIKILKLFFNNEYAKFQLQFDDQILFLNSGLVEKFNTRYSLHKFMINFTVIISAFSSIIIVGCLSILPYKEFFLSDLTLLSCVFKIVMVSILLIFIGLLIFLKVALSSSFKINKNTFIDLDSL